MHNLVYEPFFLGFRNRSDHQRRIRVLGDDSQRPSGIIFFEEVSFNDEPVNMRGYRRDGFVVQRPHDLTVTRTVTMTFYKSIDKAQKLTLFFARSATLFV